METKDPPFIETIILLLFTQLPGLIWNQLRIVSMVIPVIYFFVTQKRNGKRWEEVGFPRRNLKQQFSNVLMLVLFTGVVTQLIPVLVIPILYPGFTEHIISRIPLMDSSIKSISMLVLLYGSMIFTTLGEEIVYRGLFQTQIKRKTSSMSAILLVSLLFAGLHWFTGNRIIVLIDLGFIFIDSIVYGVIWEKSKSLIPCWLTHLCANWVGLSLLFLLHT